MRWMVWGEMSSTTPSFRSDRASSSQVHVERDRRALSGNSHASFTRCAATLGGKTSRPPAARKVDQSSQSLVLEAFRPLPNDPPLTSHLTRDGGNRPACCQQQDGLCTYDTPVWRGEGARNSLQLLALVVGQLDADRCLHFWHACIVVRIGHPSIFLPTLRSGHLLAGNCT